MDILSMINFVAATAGENQGVGFALMVFGVGLLVVFSVLLLLVGVVFLYRTVVNKMFPDNKGEKKPAPVIEVPSQQATVDISGEERAAVIAAVLAMMTEESGGDEPAPFRVKTLYRN